VPLRAVVACALLVVVVPRAHATQCRAIKGGTPALEAVDAETRLAWIDRHLTVDARNARLWSGLWGGLYGGITVVQSALAATQSDPGQRVENIVGAAASFVGVLSVVILPPSVERDESWWQKHKLRVLGHEDPCATLATAELLLQRAADSTEFGIGPLVHVGNFAINIAAGLVLGVGFNRWPAFAYVGIVGIAVGEVQVITQPTAPIEELRLYKLGALDGTQPQARNLQWNVLPWARRDGAGATFNLAF
jgi:hypothetical protein